MRILVPLLLLIAVAAGAQEPAWILLERGKSAFENRNLTAALDLILEAVESTDDFPEGEYWLGRVYAAQGQSVLAEEQYRRAIRMALYLRVPDDRFSILYSLADLLLQMDSGRWPEAEIVLSEIADSEGATISQTIELELFKPINHIIYIKILDMFIVKINSIAPRRFFIAIESILFCTLYVVVH